MDERRDPQLCARFEQALPLLLGIDGDRLPAAEEEALLAHAESCPRCSELRRSYAATVDLLRALPRKDAPPDFLSWVGREAPLPAATRRRRLAPGLWLAAAAMLAFGVSLFVVLARRAGEEAGQVAFREGPEETKEIGVPSQTAAVPPEPAPATKVEPPRVAVESPVGDGEAVGIVLNVESQLPPERWAAEVIRLETELRDRFGDQRENLQTAGESAVALRSDDAAQEPSRAQAGASREGRDFRLDIERSSLPLLVERLEGWAKEGGGSVREERGQALLERRRGSSPAAAAPEPPAGRVAILVKLRPVAGAKNP